MKLHQKLQEETLKALDSDRVVLSRVSEAYKEISNFRDLFSLVGNQVDPKHLNEVEQTFYSAQREKVKAAPASFNILVEAYPGSIKAVFPVCSASLEDALSRDLRAHVAGCFAGAASEISEGNISGALRALSGRYSGNLEELYTNLAKLPLSFSAINIEAIVTMITTNASPLTIEQSQFTPWQWLPISLTKSAIDYKLIPLRDTDFSAGFFPDYKVPFRFITTKGSFAAHITSMAPSNGVQPKKGNYICSLGDGNLGKWYETVQMTPRDTVEVCSIEPKRVYALKKKMH